MRNLLIVGNWKLNGNKNTVNDIITNVCKKVKNTNECNIAIAPPVVYLTNAKYAIYNNYISLASQNVDVNLSGAFTGEISVKMLNDIGVKYVIIGHSERRFFHNEFDEIIAKKFSIVLNEGLIPILCIGETEIEKNTGKTKEKCEYQINAIIKLLGIEVFKNSVIAYEPIWAIGKNKSATPTQIQSVHYFIRSYFAKRDNTIAEQILILYGGSVDTNNAFEIFSQKDVDGALIGRSSLDTDAFITIIQCAKKAKY
ncbi:triose-phosphate isomerase [Candidatus Providencia siddallii]|uniref:Triosephosphate isomerase n=1 Tax=Candidatus Providencia siddallii TaxID=1715285 RepID=A0ABP1CDY0_9GAMM